MTSRTPAGSSVGEEAAVDVEQAALRVRLAGEGRGLLPELLVEAGVGHRDRGLAGEHLEQLGVGRVERVAGLRVDGERADRALLADERGAHDRADPVLANVAIRRLRVDEGVVDEVVAGEDDLALAHRAAGDALFRGDRRSRPARARSAGRSRNARTPSAARHPRRRARSVHRRRRAAARPRRGFAGGRRRGRGWP